MTSETQRRETSDTADESAAERGHLLGMRRHTHAADTQRNTQQGRGGTEKPKVQDLLKAGHLSLKSLSPLGLVSVKKDRMTDWPSAVA